jgi:hypothetical protein
VTLTWISRRRTVGPDGMLYWACEECGAGVFNDDDKARHERFHDQFARLVEYTLRLATALDSGTMEGQ